MSNISLLDAVNSLPELKNLLNIQLAAAEKERQYINDALNEHLSKYARHITQIERIRALIAEKEKANAEKDQAN